MRHTEGRGGSGGLVHYDTLTGGTKKYRVPAVISVIRRIGTVLYLGTNDGLWALKGDRLIRASLVVDVHRRYAVQLRRR